MATQTPPLRRLIPLVAFVLTCVLLSVFVYMSFGGTFPFAPTGYQVELPVPNALNLVQGSDVEIAGVVVGRVSNIRRAGSGALAMLDLTPQYAPLRSGATATVRTKTLLGESYVEIAPGPHSSAPVPDGGQLSPRHVRSSVQLDEFLQTFQPGTRERMRQLFGGLAQALDGRASSLNGSLGYAAPVAGNFAAVLQTLDAQTPDLQRLFAGSGDVLRALGERAGVLRGAVTAGDAVLGVTARRNQELADTVRALPPFLDQLRETSQTITGASGDLNRAVAALLPIAPLVKPALAAINTTVPEVHSLFARLPATIAAGERGLPSLTRILGAVPAAFTHLYPAARQIIPVMQLLATYREEGLVAPLANTASAVNAKSVGPGGKIITRNNGVVYLANESIGGWVKRLPTDRANAYPSPDGLASIANLGFLKSYDCRHVNNVEYLPPTGSGVPPCVLQGPWDYRGKLAYYPRLQPAPP